MFALRKASMSRREKMFPWKIVVMMLELAVIMKTLTWERKILE
jgi:hypothetical protein